MTALVARQPIHPLSMSATQRPPRRLSARLQEKGEVPSDSYPRQSSSKDAGQQQQQHSPQGSNPRKRKSAYDEEDDGFAFSRVRKKGQKKASSESAPVERAQRAAVPVPKSNASASAVRDGEAKEDSLRKKRNKMTFSTPDSKAPATVRRSKRLSDENEALQGSPAPSILKKVSQPAKEEDEQQRQQLTSLKRQKQAQKPAQPDQSVAERPKAEQAQANGDHSTTKIALPFADTPVIRRNKEMRESKSGRSERRSSLGMRGRRASSLMESGNSNALPHAEVEVQDFYKLIAANGLLEPQRMRQLLTWCASRAMDQKALGGSFEQASAIAAARVMEEELLKDLSNRPELSNWFAREDDLPAAAAATTPQEQEQQKEATVLPERPNPKNVQNAAKVLELEDQIKRLRTEKEALEALLRPPSIPRLEDASTALSTSALSDTDKAVHESLAAGNDMAQDIARRLNAVRQNLGPTVDLFASSVHSISKYREAADEVATRVLSLCAQKLEDREKEGRRRAAERGAGTGLSPRADLAAVLRGLSRVDADADADAEHP